MAFPKSLKVLGELFASFARIGLFTFGGGYAMLPMLQREVVERHGWATQEEVLDYYAIGQCTPGVIAVNTATFIGYRRMGVAGGVVATLGVVFPSIVIIVSVAAFLRNMAGHPLVGHAFGGIRVAVVALIVQAVAKLWKSGVTDALGVLLCALAFAAVAFLKASPVAVVAISACVGVAASRLGLRKAPGAAAEAVPAKAVPAAAGDHSLAPEAAGKPDSPSANVSPSANGPEGRP